jgi:hypothetical protein
MDCGLTNAECGSFPHSELHLPRLSEFGICRMAAKEQTLKTQLCDKIQA